MKIRRGKKKHHTKKAKSNRRPIAFLEKMANKMERNLPKLRNLIARRKAGS